MSLSNEVIKIAYEAGYRIIDGKIMSPKLKELKGNIHHTGYRVFSIRVPVAYAPGVRKTKAIKVHRLVAYQKYGAAIFEEGLVVRHKDGNPLNNFDDNILIGSQSDNMMDRPKHARRKTAIAASQKNRVMTDEQLTAMRHDRLVCGLTYQEIADKYGLKNKGHAHDMVNRNYVTTK
jgi:hypothetical protein